MIVVLCFVCFGLVLVLSIGGAREPVWSPETPTCTYNISGPIYKMTAVKKADGEHPGREEEIKE